MSTQAVLPRYDIPGDVLAELATGPSGPAAIELLRSSQLTKHRLLLRHLLRGPAGSRYRLGWEILVAAHERAPAAVADLVADPLVGAWAAASTRGAVRAGSDPLGHLPALAAVAAQRAGIDAELTAEPTAEPTGGCLVLPTLGAARFRHTGPVRLRTRAGGLTLSCADATVEVPGDGSAPATPAWTPSRWLSVTADGQRLTVRLDDQDPARNCYHVPAAEPLRAVDVEHWRELLGEAWCLLVRRAPDWAAELARGLRVLVPLSRTDTDVSATSRDAFGAVALSLPAQPEHCAGTLVHELQHSKLSALLDLLPLYDHTCTERYFAPWRRDARPIGGLLQGAYAFLAVGDLWRRLGPEIPTLDASPRNFAELREELRHVLATLGSSPHLTADGKWFVAVLDDRLRDLMTEPVAPEMDVAARAAVARNLAAWRERRDMVSE